MQLGIDAYSAMRRSTMLVEGKKVEKGAADAGCAS
jgi:hypothetical protein